MAWYFIHFIVLVSTFREKSRDQKKISLVWNFIEYETMTYYDLCPNVSSSKKNALAVFLLEDHTDKLDVDEWTKSVNL